MKSETIQTIDSLHKTLTHFMHFNRKRGLRIPANSRYTGTVTVKAQHSTFKHSNVQRSRVCDDKLQ